MSVVESEQELDCVLPPCSYQAISGEVCSSLKSQNQAISVPRKQGVGGLVVAKEIRKYTVRTVLDSLFKFQRINGVNFCQNLTCHHTYCQVLMLKKICIEHNAFSEWRRCK